MNFIDPTARIDDSVKIWHFSVILSNVIIKRYVNIGSRCEIGKGSQIGERVRIGSGVFLPSNSIVEDDVFIGPNVTFTDDKYPIANNFNYEAKPPIVKRGASVGAGAVILPGVIIGEKSRIGAGAIVTKDVPPYSIVKCLPATIYENNG